jgi:hypothetical protein
MVGSAASRDLEKNALLAGPLNAKRLRRCAHRADKVDAGGSVQAWFMARCGEGTRISYVDNLNRLYRISIFNYDPSHSSFALGYRKTGTTYHRGACLESQT